MMHHLSKYYLTITLLFCFLSSFAQQGPNGGPPAAKIKIKGTVIEKVSNNTL